MTVCLTRQTTSRQFFVRNNDFVDIVVADITYDAHDVVDKSATSEGLSIYFEAFSTTRSGFVDFM